MGTARALLVTLRPHQWVKNLFVAAPLVFAKKLADADAALTTVGAVLAFCALSGAVYAVNDVADLDKDRLHPIKRTRPIPSGALSPRTALVAAAVLAAGSLTGAFVLAPAFGLVAAGYLLLNLLYSFRLKEVPFLDVSAIAGGFLLRVLGGAYAIDVAASPWLLACTALLAAFLGFGKRAHELSGALLAAGQTGESGQTGKTRRVLRLYRLLHLKVALYVLAAATSVAYVFYTLSPHTVEFFGSTRMIFTVPFCVVGILRFLVLVTRDPHGHSPTEEMLRDPLFMANLGLWGLCVLAIIYLGW